MKVNTQLDQQHVDRVKSHPLSLHKLLPSTEFIIEQFPIGGFKRYATLKNHRKIKIGHY